ncbi:MAG: VanZ family protein [Lachnospiraceae bacterium]|nr:VanZ family protein [Lachnospiraceae bacterium]
MDQSKRKLNISSQQMKAFHILLTIMIMTFIFIQSALPADLSEVESGVIVKVISGLLGTDPERTSFIVRKCAHFTEYLCLGVSLSWTVKDLAVRPGRVSFALSPWIIGTVYAVTDELHQAFVPGRSCELRDVVIDSVGVAAGVLILSIVKKGRK